MMVRPADCNRCSNERVKFNWHTYELILNSLPIP